jgi:hypothetical protein
VQKFFGSFFQKRTTFFSALRAAGGLQSSPPYAVFGHSHAAPRTPLLSPWRLRNMGVMTVSAMT